MRQSPGEWRERENVSRCRRCWPDLATGWTEGRLLLLQLLQRKESAVTWACFCKMSLKVGSSADGRQSSCSLLSTFLVRSGAAFTSGHVSVGTLSKNLGQTERSDCPVYMNTKVKWRCWFVGSCDAADCVIGHLSSYSIPYSAGAVSLTILYRLLLA